MQVPIITRNLDSDKNWPKKVVRSKKLRLSETENLGISEIDIALYDCEFRIFEDES